jgi:hypothetical protein
MSGHSSFSAYAMTFLAVSIIYIFLLLHIKIITRIVKIWSSRISEEYTNL